ETDESRKRFLTEKGYTYQLNLKTKFSEAQILYCEFQDMVEEIKVFANPDENERYGNCNVVGTAFMNKLENWPKIGVRDAEALRDLSDFLQKIIAARETTPSLAVLDFAKENVKTLNKLPFQIQNKWRGIVQQCRVSKGNGTYPAFSEFASFVKE
ncbi:unnamed protein product, partial [Porites lobata]